MFALLEERSCVPKKATGNNLRPASLPGALGPIRTADTRFRRAVLCPLSYEGAFNAHSALRSVADWQSICLLNARERELSLPVCRDGAASRLFENQRPPNLTRTAPGARYPEGLLPEPPPPAPGDSPPPPSLPVASNVMVTVVSAVTFDTVMVPLVPDTGYDSPYWSYADAA